MIAPVPHMPAELYSVAVILPTSLSPSLLAAVDSVFKQDLSSPAQLLIGINHPSGDRGLLDQLRARCPAHWHLSLFDPGYSTSLHHGGLYPAADGALRTILSYAAHSRYIAYLDEENWWGPDHLSSLLRAIAGHQWAYSQRWFVDPQTLQPLGVDAWESVGPGAGVFKSQFGGFVDASSLLIDKIACEPALRWWTVPLPADTHGRSADRNVFAHLRRHYRCNPTGKATSFFRLNPADPMHASRMKALARKSAGGAPDTPTGASPPPTVLPPQAAVPLPII